MSASSLSIPLSLPVSSTTPRYDLASTGQRLASSHHPQVISNVRSLTASLFGVAAGTLGLESYPGFIFYLIGTLLVSVLLFAFKTEGKPGAYFYRPLGDLWLGDVFGGLSGFVLTWTLFYGLVRA